MVSVTSIMIIQYQCYKVRTFQTKINNKFCPVHGLSIGFVNIRSKYFEHAVSFCSMPIQILHFQSITNVDNSQKQTNIE